jgi:hypothetical protein
VAAALGELVQQPVRRTVTVGLDPVELEALLHVAGGVTADRLRRALSATT